MALPTRREEQESMANHSGTQRIHDYCGLCIARCGTVATVVAFAICWAPTTAVLGTLYSEMFSTQVRYTGVTLGFQVGAALAGGTAPLIATFLLERFAHSWLPVAGYLVLVSGISLCCIAFTRETWNADLRTVVPSGEQRSPASLKALGTP